MRTERMYDVYFYKLDIEVDIKNKSIKGQNEIFFKSLTTLNTIQIDLFENMKIHSITMNGTSLPFSRSYNAVFVSVPEIPSGQVESMIITYEGQPQIAKRPPWDGGFVWKKDSNGKPWIGVACEGVGASLWWPNKDHLSDEPDSMAIAVTIADDLFCVSNGALRSIENLEDNRTKFNWFVSYSINNYNVTLNIADYAHFSDRYTSGDGSNLQMDYYVLKKNLDKAKTHFNQMHQILEAFEFYFDKYPFWDDGFGMVETPYLGMEHQGAIAYGNGYKRGIWGGGIPSSQNWDYILVHETAHEYWGNSVSCNDHAEMWIHESFATYMEVLYVEYILGIKEAQKLLSQYRFHRNNATILGPIDVNYDGWNSSDLYYKGAWILHTLRNTMATDEEWFDFLKGLYNKFKHSNVSSQQLVNYINETTGYDYDSFFNQYLNSTKIPFLIYNYDKIAKSLDLMLLSDVEDLTMRIRHNGKLVEISSIAYTKLTVEDLDNFLGQMANNYLFNFKAE